MSSFKLLVLGLILMVIFELFKIIIKKFAPQFHERAKKFYSWIIWGACFIVLYFIGGIKYHTWIPMDAIVNSGFITGMAVYGYELLKPLIENIFKKKV